MLCLGCIWGFFCCFLWGIHSITKVIDYHKLVSPAANTDTNKDFCYNSDNLKIPYRFRKKIE